MNNLSKWLLFLMPSVTCAQDVAPRLADVYREGPISFTAVAPDGGVWVGGTFDRIGSTFASHLVRFHPDGSLATNFTPNPDSTVIRGIVFDANERAYVSGDFKSIAGQSRNAVAGFNPGDPPTLDAGFTPQLPAGLRSLDWITLRSDGTLYAAYCLTTPASACAIVRLDAQGQVIPGFVANVNGPVFPMVLSPDEQHLFIGGSVSQVGGVAIPSKGFVAKLNATTGALDANWIPFPTGSGTIRNIISDGPDHLILSGSIPGGTEGLARVTIASPSSADVGFGPDFGPSTTINNSNLIRMPDGDLVVYGTFATVDGAAHPSHLAKLAPDGSARASWGASAPMGSTSSSTMSALPNGDVVLPRFSVPGRMNQHLYRLASSDGANLDGFANAAFSARAAIQRLVRDPTTGRVFATGALLEEIDGRTSSAVVAFTDQLTSDPSWTSDLGNHAILSATVNLSTGVTRHAVGGFAFGADGFTVPGLHLLDAANGDVVPWTPLASAGVGIGADNVRGVAIDEAGGFVYAAGISRNASGSLLPARDVNRFSLATGLLDTSWIATVSLGSTPTLLIDGGFLYVAGLNSATATDNSTVPALARFSLVGNGKADPGFRPFASNTNLQAMVMDAAFIYVGGNGTLARIDRSTGMIDATWGLAATPPGTVSALSLGDDGSLWVGGAPALGCGGAVLDAARIQPEGVMDPNWRVDVDQFVSSLLSVSGGRVLIGGNFRKVNGQTHDGLALIEPSDTIFAGEMGDPLCVRP